MENKQLYSLAYNFQVLFQKKLCRGMPFKKCITNDIRCNQFLLIFAFLSQIVISRFSSICKPKLHHTIKHQRQWKPVKICPTFCGNPNHSQSLLEIILSKKSRQNCHLDVWDHNMTNLNIYCNRLSNIYMGKY